jgi:hypothetical protein
MRTLMKHAYVLPDEKPKPSVLEHKFLITLFSPELQNLIHEK